MPENASHAEDFLSLKEVAVYFSISERYALQNIPGFYQAAGKWRLPKSCVLAYEEQLKEEGEKLLAERRAPSDPDETIGSGT